MVGVELVRVEVRRGRRSGSEDTWGVILSVIKRIEYFRVRWESWEGCGYRRYVICRNTIF